MEEGETSAGEPSRLSFPTEEVSPGLFRFARDPRVVTPPPLEVHSPPEPSYDFTHNESRQLQSVNTLSVRWAVPSLTSFAEVTSQPGSTPSGPDLTIAIRLPELGQADLVEFAARHFEKERVRVTMALERRAIGTVPQVDLIACWKDTHKATGAIELRRERVHTFPSADARMAQSRTCSFGDKMLRTISDLEIVIHRPAPTCIDTLAELTSAPVIHNDVVLLFAGPKDGPPRQLWARKADLIRRSTHFASLFASGMAESAMTPASEPWPTIAPTSIDADEDDLDIASPVAEGASATVPSAAHRIVISDGSYDLYRAVLLYLASGYIDFAPLRSRGALIRSTYVADYVRKHPVMPRPSCAIAVYKLCERLDLAELGVRVHSSPQR